MAQRNDSPAPTTLLCEALEGALGPALVLDTRLRVQGVTPTALSLLGRQPHPGDPFSQALGSDRSVRPLVEALEAGRSFAGVLANTTERRKRLHVRAVRMDSRGKPKGFVLTFEEWLDADEDPAAVVNFQGIWTRDPAMKQMFHVLERAAQRDVNVLVRGETGSGKELVATALHALSPRAQGSFHAINCAALPATLLESELFGHVKGAFTGALRDHPGVFRAAHGGTLFLDEIAEMPLDLQAKLLRVLETRTVTPVGSRAVVQVDVRIVAATHQSLRRAVELGRFRADLMYRLRVVPVFLPPLRMRVGDVALLAQHFVDQLNRGQGRQVARIAPSALELLTRHPWLGNIRELRNALEYAFVVGEGPILVDSDLPPELLQPSLGDVDPPTISPTAVPAPEIDEPTRIRTALLRAHNHRGDAAAELGLSRTTLWRKMKSLGIDAT